MKKLVLLPVFALLLFGTYSGYRWLQSPSSTVIQDTASAASKTLGDKISLKPWQTTYFSTMMPDTMRVRTTNENNLTAKLGSYLLTNLTPQTSDQVGITVAELGNNALSEIPGVKVRLNDNGHYQRSTRSYAPAGALVFTTVTDDETSIFWQHDGSYAAVVVNGQAARSGELEQALSAIVGNWQWR